jgi:hypothetical protein
MWSEVGKRRVRNLPSVVSGRVSSMRRRGVHTMRRILHTTAAAAAAVAVFAVSAGTATAGVIWPW